MANDYISPSGVEYDKLEVDALFIEKSIEAERREWPRLIRERAEAPDAFHEIRQFQELILALLDARHKK